MEGVKDRVVPLWISIDIAVRHWVEPDTAILGYIVLARLRLEEED